MTYIRGFGNLGDKCVLIHPALPLRIFQVEGVWICNHLQTPAMSPTQCTQKTADTSRQHSHLLLRVARLLMGPLPCASEACGETQPALCAFLASGAGQVPLWPERYHSRHHRGARLFFDRGCVGTIVISVIWPSALLTVASGLLTRSLGILYCGSLRLNRIRDVVKAFLYTVLDQLV